MKKATDNATTHTNNKDINSKKCTHKVDIVNATNININITNNNEDKDERFGNKRSNFNYEDTLNIMFDSINSLPTYNTEA